VKFLNAQIVGTDVVMADYRGKDSPKRGDIKRRISQSDLRTIDSNPHKWLHEPTDKKPTAAMEWGSLVDALALNSQRVRDIVAVSPQYYTGPKGESKEWNWAANECKAFKSANVGKLVCSHDKWQDVQQAVGALHEDADVMELLSVSEHQVMVTADYDVDGVIVPVCALLDIMPPLDHEVYRWCIADLKTADDASPAGWGKKAFNMGYHVQGAFYMDIVNALPGEGKRNSYLNVVQESDAPFEVSKVRLPEILLRIGRGVYERALRRYAECVTSGKWPGYAVEGGIVHGWTDAEAEAWMVSKSGVTLDNSADL